MIPKPGLPTAAALAGRRAGRAASMAATATLLLAAGAAETAAADLAEIVSRGRLRVLVGVGEQPEMFALDGSRPGFERELLEGFARLHKLQLDVVPVRDRNERLPALRRGDGDVVIGLVVTPERQQLVSFSTQVMSAPHVVVTVAPRAPIRTAAQLREARVAVLQGASWTSDLAAAGVPSARTVVYPDRPAIMAALKLGEATATVMSLFNFALLVKETPELQAGMRLGEDRRSAWAIRKEDLELLKAVDSYLSMSQSSMTWSRLVVKYFGERALEVLNRAAQN